MGTSRRKFLAQASLAFVGTAAANALGQNEQTQPTPGAPPAFGTAPPVGPEVTAETFAQAEKLIQVNFKQEELAQCASNWRQSMAAVYERRVGPHKVAIPESIAPWSRWDPVLPGTQQLPPRSEFVLGSADPGALPSNDEDIAFANVTQLVTLDPGRKLTSERLTNIYLSRLEKYNPTLRCVITLTKDHALQQAKQADQEIASGKYRGPLHGIPWGAKDLLDTAGIPTTYGAEPFRNRVPERRCRRRESSERSRARCWSPNSASARSR